MALYLLQNFISAQYLENQLVEFLPNFIYASNLARSSSGLLHVIFCNFLPELCMALDLRLNFISIQYLEDKWTEFHQIFIYAFILTRSTLGLLHIIF